jgi:hypothetical protein
MLRAMLIGLGGLFALAMIAGSMAMNFQFGFGFGSVAVTAWTWGALSVASDGLKAVLPVVITYQWRTGHKLRAMIGVVILPLVLGYGFLSALGFWAESRGVTVDSRAAEKTNLTQLQVNQSEAQARLSGLGASRLAGVIEADMAGLQRERAWQTTRACARGQGEAGRQFCKRFDALRRELAVNLESEALRRKIESLDRQINLALRNGAWREPDPLASTLASAFGVDAAKLRRMLNWWAAILVEVVSTFGLVVMGEAGLWAELKRAAGREPAAAAVKRPPWRLVGAAEGVNEAQAGR